MKRGLKDGVEELQKLPPSRVEESSPMKRGLKEELNWMASVLLVMLKSLPR